MTAKRPKARTSPPGPARRRSRRAFLVIPVELVWTRKDGVRVRESTETEVISPNGALLRTKTHIPPGTEVELIHHKTRQSTQARVVGTRPSPQNGTLRIAVEVAVPSETFWGVSF
jgi:hypothetical protein